MASWVKRVVKSRVLANTVVPSVWHSDERVNQVELNWLAPAATAASNMTRKVVGSCCGKVD